MEKISLTDDITTDFLSFKMNTSRWINANLFQRIIWPVSMLTAGSRFSEKYRG